MKVIATQRGYYKQLIEPGQLFEIDSKDHFSERWMKKFGAADKSAPAAPKPRKRRESIIIEDTESLKELGEKTAPPSDDEAWV